MCCFLNILSYEAVNWSQEQKVKVWKWVFLSESKCSLYSSDRYLSAGGIKVLLTIIYQLFMTHWPVASKASSLWGLSITRSVNTPLPAPWRHSWECRMFTRLETVGATTNSNISIVHLVWRSRTRHIDLQWERKLKYVVFTCGKTQTHRRCCWLSEAIRCCKHPTESPHCAKLPVKDVYSSSRLPVSEDFLNKKVRAISAFLLNFNLKAKFSSPGSSLIPAIAQLSYLTFGRL